ncbi:DUF1444 family protein [Brevibacillus sp. B_LB10_24]|uniref:DUF1444 family protein n=1 Tax=Brevibacillus sp. B_LB10_24 TaxID=3380645 RepID=UPI0038B9A68A
MPEEHQQRTQNSLRRRVAELINRALPNGWSCRESADQPDQLTLVREGEAAQRILSLTSLFARVQQQPEERRAALHAFVERVVAGVQGTLANRSLHGQEQRIYPVLRHSSFAAPKLVSRPHTAETVIVYALDQEKGYLIIDQAMLDEAKWDVQGLHQLAMANLQRLDVPVRTQELGGNRLYFISSQDGYAASRILLPGLLEDYDRQKQGVMLGAAVPHQDSLIIADIQDAKGAELLARLAYDFASKGDVPITPIPFAYKDGELEPYLIVKK